MNRWLRRVVGLAWLGAAATALPAAALPAAASAPAAAGVVKPLALPATTGAGSAPASSRLPVPPVATAPAASPVGSQVLDHGLFSGVRITRPPGAPDRVVLLLGSDAHAAAAGAEALTAAGAMVASIDAPKFLARLAAEGGSCSFADGALENLARHVEAVAQLPTYLPPLLVGLDGAASLVYAVQAQAAAGTFAGALSLGFCPRLALKVPLCAGKGLRTASTTGTAAVELLPSPRMAAPWVALQAGTDPACSAAAAQPFVTGAPQSRVVAVDSTHAGDVDAWLPALKAAYAGLPAAPPAMAPPPASLADLPLVEVPVAGGAAGGTDARFAVLLSGDGGWAGIDKDVAKALAAAGIPVAGFDSLRYFWSARTPQGLADDLDRLIRYYAARWNRSQVMLIGYSQGADVLPFAINRLPAATRARVQSTVLLGLAPKASFEFHLSNWIGPSGDRPVAPEAQRLSAASTVCIHGTDEKDSLCPKLAPAHVRALALKGDHHFGGDYQRLTAIILEQTAPKR